MRYHSPNILSLAMLTTLAAACSDGGQGSTNNTTAGTTDDPTGSNAASSVGGSTTATTSSRPSTSGTATSTAPTGPTGGTGATSSTGATGTTGSASTTGATGATDSAATSTTTRPTSAPPSGTTTSGTTSADDESSGGEASTSAEDTSSADPGPGPGGASAGCSAQTPLQSGTKMLNINGTNRQYILDVPSGYTPDTEYTLVFVWHPLGGSAAGTANGYDGLKNLANNTAIFVAPDGLEGGNGGVSGKGWWNADGNDWALFTAVYEEVTNNLCVNQARVFSTGFSFGGMMSYSVGFQFDVFRAVAPTSGNLTTVRPEMNNTEPLAIMAFHGDGDDFVATSGGRAALDAYVERNNCGTETQPIDPSPCVEYQGCDVPTIWCEYPGAHSPWNQMPAAVWDFFSQFD